MQNTKIVKRNKKEQIRQIIKRPKEKFLTQSQEDYWDVLDQNQITFCYGPAGVGKSFIAMKKAVDLLWDEDNKYEKLLFVRPAVEADEHLGALPGTLEEKLDPYISPMFYLLDKIVGKESSKKLVEHGFIEKVALAYMRGWNVDNTILLFEEGQNASLNQIKLLLTRIGFNSKFFISGDVEQSDKFKDLTKSGLYDARTRFADMRDVGMFEFDVDDVVRNPLITEILKRYN